MSEAVLILPNMRGGCATVGNKVHTLFRLNSRRRIVVELTAATTDEDSHMNSRGELK
ncbi:MAG TPA: hypothetical protein VGC77_22630 [Rhodopseudomonas sp.]|uniref:hypothetical protein n=1 Tax=Rhodopseudomonas sp. TaxID=1078 RepID=UPI002EDABD4B